MLKEKPAIEIETSWDLSFAVFEVFSESVSWDIPWEDRWDRQEGREAFIKEQLTLKNEGRLYFRKPNEPFDMFKALPSAGWQFWRLGEGYEQHDRVIQEWTEDFLKRLKITIEQGLSSSIEGLTTINTTGHPTSWPESHLKDRKWRFYGALFEKLILDAPEWLNLRFPLMSKAKENPLQTVHVPNSITRKILEAAQLPINTIKTDLDLERSVFGLYLQYSIAGKDQLQALKVAHYPLAFESDEQELEADEQFDMILADALVESKPKAIEEGIHPENVKWCAAIVQELQTRSINADVMTLSELTGCRLQGCSDDKVVDLFLWIIQHPHCMSEFYSGLPTPARLLDKPMTELEDYLDWRQAFYELAFGYSWPSGEEVLGPLLNFPIEQTKDQQATTINKLENGYVERRSKELELRKNVNTTQVESWVDEFRDTIKLAFERKSTASLKTLFTKNALPVFFLAGDLWRSIIETPLSFLSCLPIKADEKKMEEVFRLRLLEDLCAKVIGGGENINPFEVNEAHNGKRFESFWFMQEWPEYLAVRQLNQLLGKFIQDYDKLVLKEGEDVLEGVHRRWANKNWNESDYAQKVKLLEEEERIYSHDWEMNKRSELDQHEHAFAIRLLEFAQGQGIRVDDLSLSLHQAKQQTKPQLLHQKSIEELWGMLPNDRWQAVIEWMIEPIVEERLPKGDVYPFPRGQSKEEQARMIEDFRKRGYRLNSKILPLWSETDRANSLIIDHYTREWSIKQDHTSKANFENILDRLNAATPGKYRAEFTLTETLGAFGATPLQEHFQRDEVYHRFLDEPPIFLTGWSPDFSENTQTSVKESVPQTQITDGQEDNLTLDKRKPDLAFEKERQGLQPQLFSLFLSLQVIRTIEELKVVLWPQDEPDTHLDFEVQNKISLLRRKLRKIQSDYLIVTLKNPTRYQVKDKS